MELINIQHPEDRTSFRAAVLQGLGRGQVPIAIVRQGAGQAGVALNVAYGLGQGLARGN